MRLLPGERPRNFDDRHLVSRAGLVPVMALAQRAGLAALVDEHVRIGRRVLGVGIVGVYACHAEGGLCGRERAGGRFVGRPRRVGVGSGGYGLRAHA